MHSNAWEGLMGWGQASCRRAQMERHSEELNLLPSSPSQGFSFQSPKGAPSQGQGHPDIHNWACGAVFSAATVTISEAASLKQTHCLHHTDSPEAPPEGGQRGAPWQPPLCPSQTGSAGLWTAHCSEQAHHRRVGCGHGPQYLLHSLPLKCVV